MANTYGAAGDRDGNGWWAQMGWDIVGKADIADRPHDRNHAAGKSGDGPRSRRSSSRPMRRSTDLATGNPLPWAQGPRRMGTDKNADVLWVGNSWGPSLARINTKTNEPRSSRSPRRRCSPTTSTSTTAAMCGATSGPTTRSSNTTRPRQVDPLRVAGARHRNPPHLDR